jgi:hypothetical protein
LEAGGQEMTENQVKGLVAHVKSGGEPETYKKAVGSPQSTVRRKHDPRPAQQETAISPSATQTVSVPVATQIQGAVINPTPPTTDAKAKPRPSRKDALDGLKQAGKEAKEELKAKTAEVKAKAGGKPDLGHKLALMVHYLWVGTKLGFKSLKHLAKWVVRRVHHDCSYLAKQVVPLHGRSSGHPSGSGSGFHPIRLAAHGLVYLALTMAVYGLLLGFIASFLGGWHWIYSAGVSLAHLLCVQFPLWAVECLLHQPLVSFLLAIVVYVALLKAFKPGLWSGLLLAVLFLAVWLFRGMWMPFIPLAVNFVSEHATSGTTIPPRSNGALRQAQGPPENGMNVGSSETQNTTSTTAQPSPKASLSTLRQGSGQAVDRRLPAKPKLSAPTAPAYQPAIAWTASIEDKVSLDAELSPLPRPCRVMDFPVTADASMGEGMATGRLQDLADSDKYTFMQGHDKKQIQSVQLGATGLTLNLAGDALGNLAGNFLGVGSGPGKTAFFWEDVQAIHCNKAETVSEHPQVVYQCSVLATSLKKPFTVQCAGSESLEHLVSAMEFFIRSAKGGHEVPLSSLPYPSQGVKLEGDGTASVMWENSPMDKAGFLFGDRLWSLDTNTYGRQSRETLETALQALVPGKHNLFVVTPKDWEKARRAEDFHSNETSIPVRRAYQLLVP